jgi:hemolysin type calcium-binding protein
VKPGLRTVITGGLVAAALGLAADQAAASYSAQIQAGTLKVTGNGASDSLVVLLGADGAVVFDVGADNTIDFSADRATFEAINIDAGGGDDTVIAQNSLTVLADEPLTINGGAGADTLRGAAGRETLLGGSGNDTVDGNLGQDVARLGSGNDVFVWDPGDSSDVVDGEAGSDRLDFHGSGIGENLDVSPNGDRVTVFRNIATVTMDLGGIERLAFDPRGGADTVVVNDTTGTELERTDVDFANLGAGDTQADTVIARGGDKDDTVAVAGDAVVTGLGGEVHGSGGEPGLDTVRVETQGGSDTITGGVTGTSPLVVDVDGGAGPDTLFYDGTAGEDTLVASPNGGEIRLSGPAGEASVDTLAVEDVRLRGLGGADSLLTSGGGPLGAQVTYDGGSGNDTIRGSGGADALLGGSGNDAVDGNIGADAVLLGSGNDTFSWDPGDGSDSVEGEAGTDLVDFNASNAGENIDIAASGQRVRLFRNIASITMDFDDVEGVTLDMLGGTDTVTVNPLTGTDLATVDVNLKTVLGAGDAAADTVITNGTSEADTIRARRSGDLPVVRGVGAETRITGGGELGLDTLRIQTLGGNDVVEVGDIWDLITPVVDLGADE